jgi:hypothetical protein
VGGDFDFGDSSGAADLQRSQRLTGFGHIKRPFARSVVRPKFFPPIGC